MTGVLVIGIGNRWRGDDAAGPLVAGRLQARGSAAIEHDGDGAALIELWQGADLVILVDATRSGTAPGTIHELDATAAPVPTGLFRHSSHLFGVAEAIETARILGRLPPRLLVYGIEGGSFTLGAPMAAAVARAVEETAARILRLIASPADTATERPAESLAPDTAPGAAPGPPPGG